MDLEAYKRKCLNKEYVFGKNTKNIDYYILIAKVTNDKYLLTLLKNHEIIYETYSKGLLKTKFHAFEWLLKYNPSFFKNEKVKMVHYKEDRPNGNPWVKDTDIELNKNLAQFYKENNVLLNRGGNINTNKESKNSNDVTNDNEDLIRRFHKEMLNITEETRKFNYNPTRFKQMVLAEGGYHTAKKLLNSKNVSDGFSVLWENKALHLSVEAIVLQIEYQSLFTTEEIKIAKNRLSEFGYIIETEEISNFTELELNIDLDLEAEKAEEGNGLEGNVKYYYGRRYERDSKNRKLAIIKHGLNCYACGFNFEKVYGDRGKDFIEIHHIKPLSTLEEAIEVNPITDLVPLCANCHRMVHRRKDDVLSVEKLKEMLQSSKI